MASYQFNTILKAHFKTFRVDAHIVYRIIFSVLFGITDLQDLFPFDFCQSFNNRYNFCLLNRFRGYVSQKSNLFCVRLGYFKSLLIRR